MRAIVKIQDERGASALVIALSMIFLLGMAALAVDVGAAFNERRQDQSASDVGSLAAVQFAQGSSNQAAADRGAVEAMAVVSATLDNPALADWAACSDPGRPAKFTVLSTQSPCVSFTANLQEARVVIPEIDVETTFARVMGFDSVSTSAAAEAKADLAEAGKLLPFGLPGISAGENHVCLRVGSNPIENGPCDATNEKGNFGTLDFSLYENSTLGTLKTCGNAKPQDKLEANMIVGVDHPIVTFKAGDAVRPDAVGCNSGIFRYEPNQVAGQTGKGSNLYPGLASGSSALLTKEQRGRLAQNPEIKVEDGSPRLDNTPLWTFINPDGQPAACSGVTNTNGMRACLDAWRAGSYGALFDLPNLPIEGSVRFAGVPEIDEWEWLPGTKDYEIVNIRPVFLHTTYWGCGPKDCKIVFNPGEAGPSTCPSNTFSATTCGLGQKVNGANRLDAVTAFLLDLDMLPESTITGFPGDVAQLTYALTR